MEAGDQAVHVSHSHTKEIKGRRANERIIKGNKAPA